MSSLLVKIFLAKDYDAWKNSASKIEAVFNEHGLSIAMNKKVMGQNSALLIIEGKPEDLASVFKSAELQHALQEAGQGFLENMIITE